MTANEVVQVCKEVKKLFASDEDVQTLLKIRRTENEIQKKYQMQQKELMGIVRGELVFFFFV
jgi:hypoxanthine-guanine phosphoribosyltransferase